MVSEEIGHDSLYILNKKLRAYFGILHIYSEGSGLLPSSEILLCTMPAVKLSQ